MLKSRYWVLGFGFLAAFSGIAAAQPVKRPAGKPVGGVTTGAAVGPAAGIIVGGQSMGPGVDRMVEQLAGENALGKAAFPIRRRSFDEMMLEMEKGHTQSIVLSDQPGSERVWTFGPQGMQAVELYRAMRSNAPTGEVAGKLEKLYENPGPWKAKTAAVPMPKNAMAGGGHTVWDRWNDYWSLRKAEAALKDGKYEEARPHLSDASVSKRPEIVSKAEALKKQHAAPATGEALARLVRAARARDVFSREAALEQAGFWSGKDASAQLGAARQIWDSYSMPEPLPRPSDEPRDAGAVLRDLDAASRFEDIAAYQQAIDSARAGLLSLPRSQRAAAARTLLSIAGRWNESAASALALSFSRTDRSAATKDLQEALWAGLEGARVQNMAKELAHWTR